MRSAGPIGLDLGGKDPAETALAIMSEIVAARRGGSGMPMRDRLAAANRAGDGAESAAAASGPA